MSHFPFARPNPGFPPRRPPTYNPAIHAGLCFYVEQARRSNRRALGKGNPARMTGLEPATSESENTALYLD